jgi:hypothetical protein
MVLIEVRNSEGIVGRCDAKCYEAQFPGCECICGGGNHGAGLNAAIENTREMAETWIAKYAKENELKDWTSRVPALKPVQLPLS